MTIGKTELVVLIERARFFQNLLRPEEPEPATQQPVLTYEVVNIDALPSAFVKREVNEDAAKRVCVEWREGDPLPVVPGLIFYISRAPR